MVSPCLAASAASSSAGATPTVVLCAHSWPARRPGVAAVMASVTAAPSVSMVTMTSAPVPASAGVSNSAAPASASRVALAFVRFHTRSGRPALSRLWPIPAPMIPYPAAPTVGLSVIPATLGPFTGQRPAAVSAAARATRTGVRPGAPRGQA